MNKFASIIIAIMTLGYWGSLKGQELNHDHENSKSRGIEFFEGST